MSIYSWIVPRMGGDSDISCRENKKSYFLYLIKFSLKSYRLWVNVETFVEPEKTQMKIWSLPIACWVTKDTDTHSEYLILITLPLEQLLCKQALMLG